MTLSIRTANHDTRAENARISRAYDRLLAAHASFQASEDPQELQCREERWEAASAAWIKAQTPEGSAPVWAHRTRTEAHPRYREDWPAARPTL